MLVLLVYVIISLVLDIMNPEDQLWNMFTICEVNGKHVAQILLFLNL